MKRQVRIKDAMATMMEVAGVFSLEATPLLLPMPDGGGAFMIMIDVIVIVVTIFLLAILCLYEVSLEVCCPVHLHLPSIARDH